MGLDIIVIISYTFLCTVRTVRTDKKQSLISRKDSKMNFKNRVNTRVNAQIARYQTEQNISVPSLKNPVDHTFDSVELTLDEIESYCASFNLSAQQTVEIERAYRVDPNKAAIVALHHCATKNAARPKKMLAAKISRVTGESMTTALAEQVIEISKYAGIGAIAHYVDFGHLLPFLGEHGFEAVGTFTIVGIVAFVASRFNGANAE